MKTIAVYNMKGGVGKTTTAVNIAYLAARDGFRTLLCDLDPQGSASFYLRVKAPKKLSAKHLTKGDADFLSSVKATNYENLDILPADFSYRNLSTLLHEKKRSTKRVAEALERLEDDYDYIIIDAPAGLNLEAENIFTAAQLILIPVIPTTLSVETLGIINRFFLKQGITMSKARIFFSMVDKRKKLHITIMKELREKEGNILGAVVPYSSAIEKMGLTREPVTLHKTKSAAVLSYTELWKELQESLPMTGKSRNTGKEPVQFIS